MKRLIGLFFLSLASCLGSEEATSSPLETVALRNPYQLQQVIQGTNKFGFDLYKQLKARNGNLLFSPFSIANSLCLIEMGARGTTGDKFAKLLNFSTSLAPLSGDLTSIFTNPHPQKGENQLLIASNLWLPSGYTVNKAYERAAHYNFGVIVESFDFKAEPITALRKMNQTIAAKTKNKINDAILVSDLPQDKGMLVSAEIALIAEWETPFDILRTKRMPFKVSQTYSNNIDMLQLLASLNYRSDELLTMVEIPFKYSPQIGAQLALYILLTKRPDQLGNLEEQLNHDKWIQWISELHPSKIHLSLPRFRDDIRLDISTLLKKNGMKEAWSPQEANFSGIATGLYLNKLIHKTFLRIDEKGSDVYAASPGSHTETNKAEREIAVDHPFIYLIADKKTNTIIFLGRMLQP